MNNVFNLLQQIGKSLMLPVAVLPVAGLLLGIGASNFSFLPHIVSLIMAKSGGGQSGKTISRMKVSRSISYWAKSRT